MSKLVIALLTDDNKLEKFEELDMSWVDKFNKDFQEQSKNLPFNKDIYEEELIDMTSWSILSNFVETSNDEEFKVNREPLKNILRKIFGYEQPKQENKMP